MAISRLTPVREDSNVKVLTETPDRIHPRDLSNSLSYLYGEKRFKISLQRNIYLIYIYYQAEEHGLVSHLFTYHDEIMFSAIYVRTNTEPQISNSGQGHDLKQRIQDFKLAQQKLKEASLYRM